MYRDLNLFNSITVNEKISIKNENNINLQKIGVQNKWDMGLTGKSVTVAIIDSGIDINHSELKKNILDGFNFSDDDLGNEDKYQDYNGHGTHAAGIVSRIAPDVKLLILKVLNKDGVGNVESLIESIHYAINWKGPNEEGVRVISLSLGMRNSKKELHDAIKKANLNNISVVVSVGNEGDGNLSTDEFSFPGAYQEVIGVGAINELSDVATFSNTHKEVDVYAPGVNIYSTYLNNSFAMLSGTSMAAPHVTGSIALLIEESEFNRSKRLSESEVFHLLMKNTKPLQIDDFKLNELYLNNMYHDNIDRSLLLKCYCEVRKSQATLTHCLDICSTKEEKDFLINLIQQSANAANKIKDICKL